jgi:hypothetical protein
MVGQTGKSTAEHAEHAEEECCAPREAPIAFLGVLCALCG